MNADALALADPAAQPAWIELTRTVLASRLIDTIEETELLPAGRLRHQFSARGHELAQALVAQALRHPHDAAMGYYRSRPFLLGAGLTVREAFAGSLGLVTGRSRGRDVGVVLSLRPRRGVTVLPTSGDVGSQFTPVAGWAQAILYRSRQLGESSWEGAIAVAMGGDASVATNGFWSALTLATTLELPMVFVIEDNGLGISTPSELQTPGGNIAANLGAFGGLRVLDGDGGDPAECAQLVADAVTGARKGRGPALLRLRVPRLCGHSGFDHQRYLPPDRREAQGDGDPIARLQAFVEGAGLVPRSEWARIARETEEEVRRELALALADPAPDPATVCGHVYADPAPHLVDGVGEDGDDEAGGVSPSSIGLREAVRRTLEDELGRDSRLVVLGEDVGRKGGVHGVTAGLAARFGAARVVDTSLSEEGIIGRSVGMALAGLRPVPEIQFRKYLDPATEQVNNCGTLRWRTSGEFSAPIVVRIPVGHHARVSDPWHSVCGEAVLAHTQGFRLAFPSNARDAAGLLREALRGDDPTFFLEHRNLLNAARAASPDPGPHHRLLFGRGRRVLRGAALTLVTWGDMVHRALEAARRWESGAVEIVDLRTLVPWDRELVLDSVTRTGRCLVLHEESLTAGFGAEIAAEVSREAFLHLQAPVERLAAPDCPVPYHADLVAAVIPGVDEIVARVERLLRY